MPDATSPEQIARINAFHAKHGEAWTYIHRAGYVDEVWPGGLYERSSLAWDAVNDAYDPDERDSACVDVAHWDREGEFWSYDH